MNDELCSDTNILFWAPSSDILANILYSPLPELQK